MATLRKIKHHLQLLLTTILVLWIMKRVRPLRGQYGSPSKSVSFFSRGLLLTNVFGPHISGASLPKLAFMLLYGWKYMERSECYGGRPSRLIRRLWWFVGRLWRKTSSPSVVCEEELPKGQYLFACHPHGVLPLGVIMSFAGGPEWVEAVKCLNHDDIRVLVAQFCFLVPVMRDIYLGGNFIDAGRQSATYSLRKGKSLILFPGGASESFYPNRKDEPLVMRNREGFINLAKEHDVRIVPVYTFGESDLFAPPFKLKTDGGCDPSCWAWWLQKNIQRLIGIALPLSQHIGGATRTVIGKPFTFIVGETDAETLARYEQEIIQLHGRHARSTDKPIRIVDKMELNVL